MIDGTKHPVYGVKYEAVALANELKERQKIFILSEQDGLISKG